jgi:hypothetical protein
VPGLLLLCDEDLGVRVGASWCLDFFEDLLKSEGSTMEKDGGNALV